MNTGEVSEFSLALPPPDAQLVPDFQHIDTPIDDRGLVDVQALIEEVKATVDPNYKWPIPPPSRPNVHHFYWPEAWYPHDERQTDQVNPARFRNLPIHKGNMPREFENWLHKVTIPPPVPDPEVMMYRVEAWAVARDLFKMARRTVTWERRAQRRRAQIANKPDTIDGDVDVIGEEIMQEIQTKNFRGFDRHMRRHSRVPAEFHLVDSELSPSAAAYNLGKLIVPGSLSLVRAVAGY